jgi:transposase-like protein
LLNTAMVAERSEYLGAAPYERSAGRIGYANGYKDKQLKTRLGTLPLKVPPCCWRSPRCTCKGCRPGE